MKDEEQTVSDESFSSAFHHEKHPSGAKVPLFLCHFRHD
jgi:hypothetical protein